MSDLISKQIISVNLNQLNWPSKINDQFPTEILHWLISDDLSISGVEIAANLRIHVMKKPGSRKAQYQITGGFISFLLLLKANWDKEIECVLDNTVVKDDLSKLFYQDVCNSVFHLKSGSIATAGKAALFIELLKFGERIEAQSCFKLCLSHVVKVKGLLKLLVGFDSRSYKRTAKNDVDPALLRKIEAILNIKQSERVEDPDTLKSPPKTEK